MAPSAMKNGVDACPDLETLAAYLDGRLTETERLHIAEHLASCETCYFVFTEAAQTRIAAVPQPEPLPVPAVNWKSRRILWGSAAGLAVAASMVLAVAGLFSLRTAEPAELRALVAAVGNERPIEPRLTGGFAYGPIRSAVRGVDADTVSPDVRIAAARIEKRVVEERTAKTLHSLGISYLVLGNVARAVPILEEAADQPGAQGRVLSDLAAAYLERAARDKRGQDLTKALAAADRATKADSQLAEAWFNRAYALERLSLFEEAKRAWQDYLRLDDRTPWAAEARTHLRQLDAKPQSREIDEEQRQLDVAAAHGDLARVRLLVDRSPQFARDFVEARLLVDWAAATIAHQQEQARRSIDTAEQVARALADSSGDRALVDAVVVTRDSERGRPARPPAADLARVYQTFRAASEAYQDDRIAESVSRFEETLPTLQAADSPFAMTAELQIAIGRYSTGDFVTARRMTDLIVRAASDHHYLRVAGQAGRMGGLVRGAAGEFAAALEFYQPAADSFRRIGDLENEAAMHASLAEALDFLGETDRAWDERVQSLDLLPFVRDRRRRHTILQGASLSTLRQGLPGAAYFFQRAALDNATLWGRPLAAIDAHLYQSEIARQLGDLDLARRELQEAERRLEDIHDPQVVARNRAQMQMASGEAELTHHPSDAVAALSRALSYFQATHRNWPVARVLLARGRAYAAAGREELAERDFSEGIQLFEHQRATITDEALRGASFEQPWDLYSEMIALQAVARKRPDLALEYAERGRARTLMETVARDDRFEPLSPVAMRNRLSPMVTMLYYVALDDRLLIWTMSRANLTFATVPIRHVELAHLLSRYRDEAAMAADPRRIDSLASLYDATIRPVQSAILPGSELIIVPDGVLNAVPFAALTRREDRRYLVEDHAVQISPSFTVFVASSHEKPPDGRPWTRALVIGNPNYGAGAGIRNLPEADAEAREVAATYAGSWLLTGDSATKQQFLELAGRYEIVHFAGHAVGNEYHPELSRLLLAGNDEAARSLFAKEIAVGDFSSTRLVILGACETNVGRVRRGEGLFSLARPFLAAGVPTVIGTLWDVDDRATHRLLAAFHQSLKRADTISQAVRAAQFMLIADSEAALRNPNAWAGFAVIGGRISPVSAALPGSTN
jgi:CHAT domain-containing protein